jgi:8-oxo-dGTP pyrophosphatase MutT (NUDIX family)
MLPNRIRAVLDKFGPAEIVHVTSDFSTHGARVGDEPEFGAFAIVTTRQNEFVFQRQSYEQPCVTRSDWMIPGGGLLGDESFGEAAVREVREETGFGIVVTGLYKIFHHTHIFENGNSEWYLVVFFADAISEPESHHSPEVTEFRRFRKPPENLMGSLGKLYADLQEKWAARKRRV